MHDVVFSTVKIFHYLIQLFSFCQCYKMAVAIRFHYRYKMDKYIAVGAIDFGTSNSGYAFSFKDDPQKVYTNIWYASGNMTSSKTTTCILFDKNMKFKAFGFEAEDAYASYCMDEEQWEWYFFKEYKMALYDKMVCIEYSK